MNLFIGNLSPQTTETDLISFFSEFGKVVSAKVVMDIATGNSRCFGFVEIADKAAGLDAIDNLDSTFLLGSVVSVKEAKQNNTSSSSSYLPGKTGFGNRPLKPRIPRKGGLNKF